MIPTRNQSLGSDFSPEDIEPSWVSGGRHRFPVTPKSSPWEGCFKSVHHHDKQTCERWRDEVDKVLIFAGLFSAAVTAFTIEGYKMLQPDPVQQLAAAISHRNTTGTNSFEFSPAPSAVRINIFWFLSLVLSLTTVIVGVLSMQWLREYQRNDATTAADEALGLRQMRFHGLLVWRVPEIIGTLPILLQTAVFLFFCGILDLLWSLHRVVAIVVTVPVGLLAIFLVATTLLPALQYTFTRHLNLWIPQCPYKSPQSWIIHRLFSFFSTIFFRISEALYIKALFRFEIRERRSLIRKLFGASDWRMYDKYWRRQRDLQLTMSSNGGVVVHSIVQKDIAISLAWIINSFSRDLDFITVLYTCFQSMGDGEKEIMLLNCRHNTPLAADFSQRLGGQGVPAVGDYLSIRALDHLLRTIGYGSDATWDLLQHRVELYIRVIKATIHLKRRPMLYCPFKYYSRFSDEVQIQLLEVATIFLSQSDLEADFATAIMVLRQTSTHPAIRLSPIQPIDGQEHHQNHDATIDGVASWQELRRRYSKALTETSGTLLRRREILGYKSVRFGFYRWFLHVIQSTATSNTLLNATLPIFKTISPAIQSTISAIEIVDDTEYPTHPIFKLAWKTLLEKKYAELTNIMLQHSGQPDSRERRGG